MKNDSLDKLAALRVEIAKKENSMRPLYIETENLARQIRKEVKTKLLATLRGEDKFDEDELKFAATERCQCGAGLAYPIGIGMHGAWRCSDELLDRNADLVHTEPISFAESNIESETQSPESGTTRK